MTREITVAVVGAGAAGLNALRVLNHAPEDAKTKFKATAFEQSPRIGGTWFYTDCVGTDESGLPVHSSMYRSHRTNLPKEIMAYPDYPFPSHLPSFVPHQDVYRYLEDYTTHFDLWKDIKFHTVVERIVPVSDENGVKWEVTTADVTNRGDKQTGTFDAVLVCNGHYSKPLTPQVPGLERFDGSLIHSRDYRHPDAYTGRTVLVLGAKRAGIDISCEVAGVARKVYLSHNYPKLATILPAKIEQRPGIKRCRNRVIEFKDGRGVVVDVIILCTGYLYNFPFLDDSIGIEVENGRVTSLYKHFLSVDYPSLGIVGIVGTVLPFPVFHFQNTYFRSILDGTGALPSRKEMLCGHEEEEEEDEKDFHFHKALCSRNRNRNGNSCCQQRHYAQDLAGRQFKYLKELADLGRFGYLPSVIEKIYHVNDDLRSANVTAYKNFDFILSDDCTGFKVVEREGL